MRTGRLTMVVVLACMVAPVAWGQLWYGGASAYELGRGGTGVALPSGPATGSNNPATLGMLYRMPGANPEYMAAAESSGAAVATMPDREIGRGLLAFPRGSEFGRLSVDPPQYGDAWAALPPAHWLAPETLPRDMQVTIESRVVTVDQSFLENVGTDWNINRMPVWSLNYAGNTDDLDFLQGAQATYGQIGGEWAFGGGWLSQFDEDLFYLAAARSQESRLLSAPSVLTLGARAATIEIADDNRFIADVGATAFTDTTVFGRPTTASAGVVVHDLFDETGEFTDAGVRLDVGVALTGDDGLVALDIVDVLDDTGGEFQGFGGRHVRVGTEIRIADSNTFVLGGLIRDELTVGVRQKIPMLGNIPGLNLLFSHTDDEDRAEIMIFITPRIINGE